MAMAFVRAAVRVATHIATTAGILRARSAATLEDTARAGKHRAVVERVGTRPEVRRAAAALGTERLRGHGTPRAYPVPGSEDWAARARQGVEDGDAAEDAGAGMPFGAFVEFSRLD